MKKAGPEGDQHQPAKCRAEGAGCIELCRVEGHGVEERVARHQFGDERLPCGRVDTGDDASHGHEADDHRHRGHAGDPRASHHDGHHSHGDLGDEQYPSPIQPIGDGAAQR